MDLARLRNFGIAAHIDAGKTTVSERMLYISGVEHRIGQVDEGTTVLDWMAEERERGITITAAATRLPWADHDLNLIDTPGHVDFTVEVERSMRVLDGAVLVIDAVMGVQAQSETVWRQIERHRVPAIAFVNKCDRPGADYLAAISSIQARLGAPAIAAQYPVYEDDGMKRVVDLLTRTMWEFRTDRESGPEGPSCEGGLPCPSELVEEVGVLRQELLEALADLDDALMAELLEEREPPLDLLHTALRKGVLQRKIVPVYCGVALRTVGIQPLMDAVVRYLPSPLDVPPVRGTDPARPDRTIECRPDPEAPLAALAFKILSGPHGDLTFVRIYSGTLRPGQALWNPRLEKKERIARVLRMHADAGVALEEASAGDIVALSGCKWSGTGDTLCPKTDPVILEPLTFPEPVISRVVEPESAADRDKLRQALERLAREDPSFHLLEQEDTGQWLISGMGELHLEVLQHRLVSELGVSPRVGEPRVAYREAVRGTGLGRGVVDRTIGGKEAYAAVGLRLSASDDSIQPTVRLARGVELPTALAAALRAGLLQEARVGPRFGFPLVRAEIEVLTVERKEGRDSEAGMEQAAVHALRQAMEDAEVVLEEPLMEFDIHSPGEFASGIIADLNARHAELTHVEAEGPTRSIQGRVPLSAMFGYSTAVRSLSQGRAGFSMLPSGYRPVPEHELEARGLTWS